MWLSQLNAILRENDTSVSVFSSDPWKAKQKIQQNTSIHFGPHRYCGAIQRSTIATAPKFECWNKNFSRAVSRIVRPFVFKRRVCFFSFESLVLAASSKQKLKGAKFWPVWITGPAKKKVLLWTFFKFSARGLFNETFRLCSVKKSKHNKTRKKRKKKKQ